MRQTFNAQLLGFSYAKLRVLGPQRRNSAGRSFGIRNDVAMWNVQELREDEALFGVSAEIPSTG